MTENTNQTPGVTAGYGPEGRELEKDSLAYGEPARTPGDVETAAAGDASEMLGEVLQSQELNPDEPYTPSGSSRRCACSYPAASPSMRPPSPRHRFSRSSRPPRPIKPPTRQPTAHLSR